jgi:uncharacterized membrane protein YkoI
MPAMSAKAALSLNINGIRGLNNPQENHDMSRSILMVCAAAVLCSASALARTAEVSTNDAVEVPYAAISLDAAIAAAEKHAHGSAVRADYEKQQDGQWAYDIEVRSGPKVFDVKVDAEKGTVIASTEDKADADDGVDKAD